MCLIVHYKRMIYIRAGSVILMTLDIFLLHMVSLGQKEQKGPTDDSSTDPTFKGTATNTYRAISVSKLI